MPDYHTKIDAMRRNEGDFDPAQKAHEYLDQQPREKMRPADRIIWYVAAFATVAFWGWVIISLLGLVGVL